MESSLRFIVVHVRESTVVSFEILKQTSAKTKKKRIRFIYAFVYSI